MRFLTHLDLFSGIGGFAIAAQACGFRTVAFCEIEPYAQQVLKEKFGAVMADANGRRCPQCDPTKRSLPESDKAGPRLHPDIFALNGADYLGVDLVTGGFPCQPYSLAGKRRGAADDRAIWREMRRIIAEARPAWVLGENVPGIIGMELDRVLSDLEALGYACWPLVIPACAVDARHRRDRVWIAGHANNAKAARQRQHRRKRFFIAETRFAGKTGEPSSNSNKSVFQERQRQDTGGTGENGWTIPERVCSWLPEPDVGRVVNGIPARAHRLRALGNAIVPQVAQAIIRNIANLESPPDP